MNRNKLTECEMCGEMHRCRDGYCKKCDEALDRLIEGAILIARVANLVIPWYIGMNEIKKYQDKMENDNKQ